MKRKIITIDETKCTGCGRCIPKCPEGAIQIIDGKARLVSDLSCDGLGACLGHCPEGAISIEEREAVPYDERIVMKNIIRQGTNVINAHIRHLHDHNEQEYLQQARAILAEEGISMETEKALPPAPSIHYPSTDCPGSRSMQFGLNASRGGNNIHEKNSYHENISHKPVEDTATEFPLSELRHWPIQMHLISPVAPQYRGVDVILAADCVAYSLGDFHRRYLQGKALIIACPKLDSGKDVYLEKLRLLIDDAKIATLTVIMMEVPCCGGLMHLVHQAAVHAQRNLPVKAVTISVEGKVLKEEWVC